MIYSILDIQMKGGIHGTQIITHQFVVGKTSFWYQNILQPKPYNVK